MTLSYDVMNFENISYKNSYDNYEMSVSINIIPGVSDQWPTFFNISTCGLLQIVGMEKGFFSYRIHEYSLKIMEMRVIWKKVVKLGNNESLGNIKEQTPI